MIFIDNKYTATYYRIVERARFRNLTGYAENHHIIPESFYINRGRSGSHGFVEGNPDNPDNIIRLTAREHFICHWLLTKMILGEARYKVCKALLMLRLEGEGQQRYHTKITARVYSRIKEEHHNQGTNNPCFDATIYDFYHNKADAHERMTQYAFYTKYSIPACSISLLVNGKQKSVKGWRMENIPPVLYTFYHSVTAVTESLTMYEFYKKYGIARTDVWNLINLPKCRSVRGWSLI